MKALLVQNSRLSLFLIVMLMPLSALTDEPVEEREFLREVMGQPHDKVKKYLGEPDSVRTKDKYEYWIYHNRVRDMISKQVFKVTQVLFVDGRVADSIHSQVEVPQK